MKRIILLSMVLTISFCAFAQNEVSKKENNPLDISRELEKIAEYGVPTIQLVEQMKAKADTLYNSNSWADAIVAYEEFAKKANWLANLLSQCVEPYYSASYDDKKNISYSVLKKYAPYEKASNDYKKLRNEAYVKIGLCHKQLGHIDKAVVYLYKGLDLVNVDEGIDWSLAVDALSEIIGFKAE